MMTPEEYIKAIKYLNPNAHGVVWGTGEGMTVKWDAAHQGIKPTLKECETVLPQVQTQILNEKVLSETKEKAKVEAQVKEAVLSLQDKGELTILQEVSK